MTNQPATPLENKEAITRLSNTIDRLVLRFIEPLAQQSVATQAIVEANASAITNLTQVTDDVAAESAGDGRRAANNSANIENLLADARTDREQWRTSFEEMQRKSNERFEEMRRKSDEDRARWQTSFDAQQEVMQRLLLEIRSTNGAVSGLGSRVDNLEAG